MNKGRNKQHEVANLIILMMMETQLGKISSMGGKQGVPPIGTFGIQLLSKQDYGKTAHNQQAGYFSAPNIILGKPAKHLK